MSLDCRDQPYLVVLMTLVVVFATVVINAITMAPVMKLLKMTERTPSRKMMLNGSFSKLRQKTEHTIHELHAEQTFFKDVDWEFLRDPANGLDLTTFYPDILKADVDKAAWLSVLDIERKSYLRQYEHGLLTREGFAALENFMATLSAKARTTEPAELHTLYDTQFHSLADSLLKRGPFEYITNGGEWAPIRDPACISALTYLYVSGAPRATYTSGGHTYEAKLVGKKGKKDGHDIEERDTASGATRKIRDKSAHSGHSRLSFYDRVLLYQVAKAYITGQLDVKHSMALYKRSEAQAHDTGTAEEVEKAQKARQDAIDAMSKVEQEHLEILDTMRNLLDEVDNFGDDDPRRARKERKKFAVYKTRYAGKLVLLEQRHVVEHLVHEGLLDDLDSAPLIAGIDKKIEAIELAPLQSKIEKAAERYLPCIFRRPVGAERKEVKLKDVGNVAVAATRAGAVTTSIVSLASVASAASAASSTTAATMESNSLATLKINASSAPPAPPGAVPTSSSCTSSTGITSRA